MPEDAQEMSADLMSRDGLKRKVRCSVRDFVIWMQSLEEMTVWLQNLQMRQKRLMRICSSDRYSGSSSDRNGLPGVKANDVKKDGSADSDSDTDGMELYDKGEEKAYLALFEKFSDKNEESEDMNDKDRPRIGIIGMTSQDVR